MLDHILAAPVGEVLSLDGLSLADLRVELGADEPALTRRRLILVPIAPAVSASAVAEAVVSSLADVALKLWPFWYGDAPLTKGGTDTLGRMAAAAAVRRAAAPVGGALLSWADAAAQLAAQGRRPEVLRTPIAIQLEQLGRVIAPDGLVIATEIVPSALSLAQAVTFVHALEWIARNLKGTVVALFSRPPANPDPFLRIRHRGLRVSGALEDGPSEAGAQSGGLADDPVWFLPWRGRPHPLSAVEKRMASLLGADAELGPLFQFNQAVETVRGSRPKVDIIWPAGRLVVELDGYADHGTRAAFVRDRHRDYELTLSGYTVLRLPNDEIVRDCWLALEKIRDLVRHRREVLPQEARGG
ncbi:endonuclease domain-containing protein [Roseixanthobacter liquoris]|uniref:endonuclease domain-containing protein n=1 Tax=Roseixanthobacter liquoris TaxID=3119921 RepID=UPI003729B271